MFVRSCAVAAIVALSVVPAHAQSADGRWDCRVGTALLGHLSITGTRYGFDSADGQGGEGELSHTGIAEALGGVMDFHAVSDGALLDHAGISRIGLDEGSEYPALYLFTADGHAATCVTE